MEIGYDEPLKAYNTFGFEAHHKGIIRVTDEGMINEVIEQKLSPIKILGGGSNILINNDIDAYILKNEIKGIHIVSEDDTDIVVKVGAGEYWHSLVMWSLSHGLAGLENLSLIPGSVGAAPMQNIGAYGVEQDLAFDSLEAIHLLTGTKKIFMKDECHFGYRDSIFKNELKDQYFITHVSYQLKKKNYTLHIEYGAIREVLQSKKIDSPTIHDVSEAVIEIRKSKLPDPKYIGNAGSFFKNPVISASKYKLLKGQFSDLPSYPIDDDHVKVPAGWLIEKAGWKGHNQGHVGVHHLQSLVLVHFGHGTGAEIKGLALQIQSKVKDIFGIDIVPEVNFW